MRESGLKIRCVITLAVILVAQSKLTTNPCVILSKFQLLNRPMFQAKRTTKSHSRTINVKTILSKQSQQQSSHNHGEVFRNQWRLINFALDMMGLSMEGCVS